MFAALTGVNTQLLPTRTALICHSYRLRPWLIILTSNPGPDTLKYPYLYHNKSGKKAMIALFHFRLRKSTCLLLSGLRTLTILFVKTELLSPISPFCEFPYTKTERKTPFVARNEMLMEQGFLFVKYCIVT